VIQTIDVDQKLQLRIIATGMHLSPHYGMTVEQIAADGFAVDECVESLVASDQPGSLVRSMGLGLIGFAAVFERLKPDIVVVVGDRFDMYPAALATIPFKIPVAHIHGGELTQGLIDDPIRHSVTKISHLHFVSTETYARRVIQMGEEPWRVIVSGAPGLDNLHSIDLLDDGQLFDRLGFDFQAPPLVVTFHPVTLEYEATTHHIGQLLGVLSVCEEPIIFTMPNADTSGQIVQRMIEDFVTQRDNTYLVDNLGTQVYFSLMTKAAALIGNSSSGIIEAASFKLPVVNIGTRQGGRVRPPNVIDVGYDDDEIAGAIRQATSAPFRASLATLQNPYGDGKAAQRIVQTLRSVELGDRLIQKHFHDLEEQ
jgi:UDP-N-acetylglucosamine 2-epimerase (non-hydrolysing)/GDP/UDP-N,N'-diacetylbacillosamine 2-epimerase (hydrolysing)